MGQDDTESDQSIDAAGPENVSKELNSIETDTADDATGMGSVAQPALDSDIGNDGDDDTGDATALRSSSPTDFDSTMITTWADPLSPDRDALG